jgi:hypothetical protein
MPRLLEVKYPFDLRTSMDEKIALAKTVGTWTALLNNAGSLCHLIHPEAGWIIRIPFKPTLKYCHPDYLSRIIYARLAHYIIMMP